MVQCVANEELLKELVRDGRFTVSKHSLPHRLKEGFSAGDMVQAVLRGSIIEDYPERSRCLFYGQAKISTRTTIDLHGVCDYSDENWADFVTGYIPDPLEWHSPPTERR